MLGVGAQSVDASTSGISTQGAPAIAVTAAELPRVALEISLLESMEVMAAAGDVEIGRHGLVVERGWHRGLLLPQVATDWGWDRERFLAETCRKAGLPRDAWKHGATLWRFEADVFGER